MTTSIVERQLHQSVTVVQTENLPNTSFFIAVNMMKPDVLCLTILRIFGLLPNRKGSVKLLKVCCSQIHRTTLSARELAGISRNNCLNIFLPALIENYDVTSVALFCCQLPQLNLPKSLLTCF